MSTTTIESVASRLDGLERQNIRLRWVAGGLLIAAMVLLVEATVGISRGPKVVEAERLVIRDKAGRVRARLGIDGREPTLQMYDARGMEQVNLGITGTDSSALSLSDHGQTKVRIEAEGDGGSMLRLFNNDYGTVSSLFMNPAGSAGLSLTSRTRGLTMGVVPDGQSALFANDSEGRETGRVGSTLLGFESLGLARPPGVISTTETALIGPPADAKACPEVSPGPRAQDLTTMPDEPRSSYHGASN